jgi:hypothetical protein
MKKGKLTMTFDEFLLAVERDTTIYAKDGEDYTLHPYRVEDYTKLPFADDEPFAYYEWCVGGMGGGSCWGDEARPFSGESEPDDNAFTRIIENFGDNISYMKFRRLNRELLHEFSYHQWEYYGNYSKYRGKAFSLKALYRELFGDVA